MKIPRCARLLKVKLQGTSFCFYLQPIVEPAHMLCTTFGIYVRGLCATKSPPHVH